jgi:hypothetical protein
MPHGDIVVMERVEKYEENSYFVNMVTIFRILKEQIVFLLG